MIFLGQISPWKEYINPYNGRVCAYGTNVDASDIDIRGVTIESKQDIIGLSSFEQFEDRTTDTVIYGLKSLLLCA